MKRLRSAAAIIRDLKRDQRRKRLLIQGQEPVTQQKRFVQPIARPFPRFKRFPRFERFHG